MPIIDEYRTRTFRAAIGIFGTQVEAANELGVDKVTISRWAMSKSPIPEAVIIWAKSIIKRASEELAGG